MWQEKSECVYCVNSQNKAQRWSEHAKLCGNFSSEVHEFLKAWLRGYERLKNIALEHLHRAEHSSFLNF